MWNENKDEQIYMSSIIEDEFLSLSCRGLPTALLRHGKFRSDNLSIENENILDYYSATENIFTDINEVLKERVELKNFGKLINQKLEFIGE